MTIGEAAFQPVNAQIAEAPPVRHVAIPVNKSKTLRFGSPFSTAVIGSLEIADVLPMTDHTLYVQGKKVGTTNISVFDAEKHLVAIVDLDIEPDTASLSSKILASDGSRRIKVSSANGQVVLSGEAGDAVSAARAVDVARGLAKDAPVIDAMKVAPSQQVMLKVRFLEVDRDAGRDLGINWFGGNKNGMGVTGLGQWSNSATAARGTVTSQSLTSNSNGTVSGTSTTTNVGGSAVGIAGNSVGGSGTSITAVPLLAQLFPGAGATAAPFGAMLAQVINVHGFQVDALISALEDKGLVKTLAEPNLIAKSGQQASFFAGGQIPVPTVQPGSTGSVPTVSVTYYNCGVQLNFVPTVLSGGVINVQLAPQVCEVASGSTPVYVNGTAIPELTTRSANTTVELRDGQSFAIAGLLEAQSANSISQVPWLGNMPVLGALFRSTSYQKHETDLVVIVSPHLVRPAAPGTKLATPFDTTLSANDVDLFLMGDTERKKTYTEFVTSGGGLQGPYGHILDAR